MTDLRRLGKRGSYRLGRLAAPPAEDQAPRPRHPSFHLARRGPVGAWVAGVLTATGLIAAASVLGWWFVPFIVGVAAGPVSRWGRLPLRTAAVTLLAAATVGWGVPLAWVATVRPAGTAARTAAALAGAPPHTGVLIAAALLVAAAEAVAGLGLGRAVTPLPRGLIAPRRRFTRAAAGRVPDWPAPRGGAPSPA